MAEKKSLFPIFTQAAKKRAKKADEEDGGGGGGAATQHHQTQPTPAAVAATTTGNAASSKKRRNSSSTPASAPRSQVRDAFFLPLARESSVSRFEAEPEKKEATDLVFSFSMVFDQKKKKKIRPHDKNNRARPSSSAPSASAPCLAPSSTRTSPAA